jgi:hypothetical protein
MERYKKAGHIVAMMMCGGDMLPCLWFSCSGAHNACETCTKEMRDGAGAIGVDRVFVIGKDSKTNTPLSADAVSAIKRAIISQRISFANNDYTYSWDAHKEECEKDFENAVRVFAGACNVIEEYKPDMIYMFNGRFWQGAAVMEASRNLKVTFYTHDQSEKLGYFEFEKNNNVLAALPKSSLAINMWIDSPLSDSEKEKIADTYYALRINNKDKMLLNVASNQVDGVMPEKFNGEDVNVLVAGSSLCELYCLDGGENCLNPVKRDDLSITDEIAGRVPSMKFWYRAHPGMLNRN